LPSDRAAEIGHEFFDPRRRNSGDGAEFIKVQPANQAAPNAAKNSRCAEPSLLDRAICHPSENSTQVSTRPMLAFIGAASRLKEINGMTAISMPDVVLDLAKRDSFHAREYAPSISPTCSRLGANS
jgi:hypothetical protein